ncbi:MAG: hypothetical protein ACR2FY_23045 [Pirellulaceae bacterium]
MKHTHLITLGLGLAVALGCGGVEKTEMVPMEKVPNPVLTSAKEKLPDVKFDTAWKTKDGNFEVRGKTAAGKVRDIQVSPDGKVLEVD